MRFVSIRVQFLKMMTLSMNPWKDVGSVGMLKPRSFFPGTSLDCFGSLAGTDRRCLLEPCYY